MRENSEYPGKSHIQIRWSIKWKLMLMMTVLIVGLMIILTSIQISSQKAVLEGELQKRIALMRANLIERGKSFILTLAQQVENDIAAFNFSGVIQAVNDSIEYHREIKYAILVDQAGMVYVHTLHPELMQRVLDTERSRIASEQHTISVLEYSEEDGTVIEIVNPIQISTTSWGILRLVYTLKQLEEEIDVSRTQIALQTRRIVYKSILMSFCFILIAFFLVYLLSTRVSQPLIHLTQAARSLSKGDFPVSMNLRVNSKDEIGVLAESFTEMSQELKDSYEKLAEYNRTLEQRVAERTKELHESLRDVEKANTKIMQSIEYARLIQYALLPNPEEMKTWLPQSFILWLPRDVVGGDIFFAEFLEDQFVIAVIDCTGHGVPGAFMTMIASSTLTRIIRDDGCANPAEILRRLNTSVKAVLHQNQTATLSDNGFDAAICLVKPGERELIFSGAKLPLFFTYQENIHVVKGDRCSVGYKRSNLEFAYSTQTIQIEKDMAFYMATDGYIDQLGGTRNTRFGSRRFKQTLQQHCGKPFEQQREMLLQAFNDYKKRFECLDDVTVVGFNLNHLF